ncbi:MAG TPA: HNH endonuclease [Anaeromyxobacteraceae bacterium]|nr:HNH endonuclease [Anaeromyxobacteraceae bacterium]
MDHVLPAARGGPSTIDNLRVLCRFHNDLAARQVFGEAWMQRHAGRRGA